MLVVDNSASMNAIDVPPTRLDAAKAEGRRLIDGMRLGDELAIIAAGAQPRVACGPTDHRAHAPRGARLDRRRRRTDPGRPRPSPWRAGCSPAPRKSRKVVVLTDGGFDGAADLAARKTSSSISVGKKTGNVGITRFQARRSLLDPIGYEILVEVVNASDEPVSCRLELDLDDDPIDVVPLDLARRRDSRSRSSRRPRPTAAGSARRSTGRDSLPADNTAWAILPRRARQKVTLVTPGNLFLEKVFEAIPLVDLEVVKVAADAQAALGTRAAGAAGSITVFHRKVPDVLPAGPRAGDRARALVRSGSSARRSTTRWSPSKTKIRR